MKFWKPIGQGYSEESNMTKVTLSIDTDQVNDIVKADLLEFLNNPVGIPRKELKAMERVYKWYCTPQEITAYKESPAADWRGWAQ